MDNKASVSDNGKDRNTIRKEVIAALIVSAFHLIITFFTDRHIFTVSPSENLSDYIICKVIAFFVLFALYSAVFITIHHLIRKEGGEPPLILNVIKWSLPYLLIVIPVCFFKLSGGYLSNDENLIYENAVTLTHYTWFYYITTYYYIVSLMLIPFKYGPIIMKLLIELCVTGYVTFRINRIFGKKYGIFSYMLFLLYPVIAYTTSAHRLPVYFFVYLYLFSTLIFDLTQKKAAGSVSAPDDDKQPLSAKKGSLISLKKELWLIFISAILTQWRTEGIYLIVISTILMFMAYDLHKDRKRAVLTLILVLVCQYLVSVPQNGFFARELSAAADDRMKPFYAYTVTNMFRNGLDRDKNRDELEIIDRYISIEKIDAINDYYGDINYEDVLILYMDGFVGVREEAGLTEYFDFANACKKLFMNNIPVLFRTRTGAFLYAALPYHITLNGTDPKALLSFGISIVKTVMYNLFIPVIIILLVFVYSVIKRRWFTFFVTGGLLSHLFIVFVLAPASYFKYYFPVYIMGYFYLMLIIMSFIKNRSSKNGSTGDSEGSVCLLH
ncbi:MAG: hypothetical protein K5886_01930 [Lachnospiraceae bacterium]|nr:hypothetical protein [Lachnospiraceae bacterium]